MILLNRTNTAIKIIKTKPGKTILSILDQPFMKCFILFRHNSTYFLFLEEFTQEFEFNFCSHRML